MNPWLIFAILAEPPAVGALVILAAARGIVTVRVARPPAPKPAPRERM